MQFSNLNLSVFAEMSFNKLACWQIFITIKYLFKKGMLFSGILYFIGSYMTFLIVARDRFFVGQLRGNWWCFYPLCWSLMIMTNMTFASFSSVYSPSAGGKASSLLLNTCDEKLFGKNLEKGQTKLKHHRRTSSPVDFESFILNSVPTDISELQSRQSDIPPEVKGEQLLTCGSFKAPTELLTERFFF